VGSENYNRTVSIFGAVRDVVGIDDGVVSGW
jgi:hypothetical protein